MASATENVIQLDNSKCRICLFTKHNLCPLFRRGLSMKVMKLADIKMYEGDGLPSSICLDCELEVKRSTNFIAQIQRADAKWREILAKEKELCGIDEKHKELSVRLPEKEDMYQVASTSQSNILYDQSNILHDQDNMLFEQGNMLHDNNYHAEVENESPMIEIEEFNVKQEIPSFDQFLSEKEEVHSEGDHDHYGDVEHGNDQPEDENELNPLDHVDIVEDRSKGHGMELSNDPLGQEEPLIETQRNENETSVDPLTCMKQEVVAMDIDKDTQVPISVQQPAVSGPSSSVKGTVATMPFFIWPQVLSSNETRYDLNTLHEQQYNVLGLKQNSILNTASKKRKASTTSVITDSERNTSSLGLKTDVNTSKLRKILSKSAHFKNISDQIKTDVNTSKVRKLLSKSNAQHFKNISDQIKKPKETNIEQEELKVLIEEYKCKWRKNESFCITCLVSCGSLDLLMEHKEKTDFICRICTAEFKHHSDLEDHFFNHKPTKCKLCQEICFSRKDLLFHKRKKHQSDRLRCDICNKSFAQDRSLKAHKIVEHSGPGNSLKCVVCEKTFKIPLQLHAHMVRVHHVFESQECKFCRILITGPDKLKQHVKSKHLDCIDNALVSCKTCGKVFRGTTCLSQHEKTHDRTECLCDLCGKSIIGKSAMKTHMNITHSKKLLCECKYCNVQFGSKMELKRHYKKCPKKLPAVSTPLFCEICGKQYKNSTILNMHKKTHCDERPYKCEDCGATFRQSVTLRTHRRVHSSVGKYCCGDCGLTFKWKQTFDKHMSKCDANNHQVKLEMSQ